MNCLLNILDGRILYGYGILWIFINIDIKTLIGVIGMK